MCFELARNQMRWNAVQVEVKMGHRSRQSRSSRLVIVILFVLLLCLLPQSLQQISISTLLHSPKPPSAKELSAALSHIARNCRVHARISAYGKSRRGRRLEFIHLSTSFEESKTTVLATAGIHGREQQGPFAMLLALDAICRSSRMLGNTALIVVPLANPDGYEYARTVSRTWRKTYPVTFPPASRCKAPKAIGVDLNRNFPSGWAPASDPCDVTYPGTHPLSEFESIALAKLTQSLSADLYAHLDLHSFGSLLFRGTAHGGESKRPAALARQRRLARAIRMAVRKRTGAEYEDWSASVDPVSGLNRSIGGTFMDFVTESGIPSVTMELGPKWTLANRGSGFFEGRNMTVQRGGEIEEALSVLIRAANSGIPQYADSEIGKINP